MRARNHLLLWLRRGLLHLLDHLWWELESAADDLDFDVVALLRLVGLSD